MVADVQNSGHTEYLNVRDVKTMLGCYSDEMEHALRMLLQGFQFEGLLVLDVRDVIHMVPPHERVERRDAIYGAVAAAYMAADEEETVAYEEIALAYVTRNP